MVLLGTALRNTLRTWEHHWLHVEAHWDPGSDTKKFKISTYPHPLRAHLAPIGYMQILFLKLVVTILGLK